MNNLLKHFYFTLLLFVFFQTHAQQEQTLSLVPQIWQSTLLNPALIPDKKIHIALPSIYVSGKSDFALNDFIHVDKESGRRQIVDTLVLAKLNDSNKFSFSTQIQTLAISFPVNEKLQLSVYHALDANGSADLNGNLARLFIKGNTQFAGNTVSLSSGANSDLHSELGVGGAYKINENFTVGVRAKYLSGITGAFTVRKKFDAKFDIVGAQILISSDFALLTFDESKLGKINTVSDLLSNGLFGSNAGYAFDLGATYKIGKIKISASILDIGGTINWETNGKTYSTFGNTVYVGDNAANFFNADNYKTTHYIDTLKKYTNYNETSNATYKQTLPLRMYLSGTYQLNDTWAFGALVYNESNSVDAGTGFTVNGSAQIGKVLNCGLSYGLRNGTINNLGLHFVLKLGPVQLYGVTDNIIAAFRIYDVKTANGRLGVNLIF
jgi:hypothetical protein